MSNSEEETLEPTYRIGAVSRLTGVAPDTLRVWERRYGTVTPTRSTSGTRLYSQEDIGRLTLIKRLVDSGDAISAVANLTLEQLTARLKGVRPPEIGERSPRVCRLLVFGKTLPSRLGEHPLDEEGRIELVGSYSNREQFDKDAPGLRADVCVLEYPAIQPDTVRDIQLLLTRAGATYTLVVYQVAAQSSIQRLESDRVFLLRGPLDARELRAWCRAIQVHWDDAAVWTGDEVNVASPPPPRRYDDLMLAEIAAASVALRCECPHHLADLISGLSAFEAYCRDCEVMSPDDAVLHTYLHKVTARARSMLETALARLVEAECIVLSTSGGTETA